MATGCLSVQRATRNFIGRAPTITSPIASAPEDRPANDELRMEAATIIGENGCAASFDDRQTFDGSRA
jgi:hypothetical protein